MVQRLETPHSNQAHLGSTDITLSAQRWDPGDDAQATWNSIFQTLPQQSNHDDLTHRTDQEGTTESCLPLQSPSHPQPQTAPFIQPTVTGSTNPFRRHPVAHPSLCPVTLSSADTPSATIPSLPDVDHFADPSLQSAHVTMREPSYNPWQPALDSAQASAQKDPQLVCSSSAGSLQQSAQPLRTPDLTTPLISLATDDADSVNRNLQETAETLSVATAPEQPKEVDEKDWSLIDCSVPTPQVVNADVESNALRLPLSDTRNRKRSTPSFSRLSEDLLKETYQIRKITWTDFSAAQKPRTSPILTQNVNGPCPLLAIVNTLALTAPENERDSPLVEMLMSREEISLQLLVDALFEELISGNRIGPDTTLSDPSLMYAFLKELHTGMNVNPRYLPLEGAITAPNSQQRGEFTSGTFEPTAELELYSSFHIPLMHGWLPHKGEPVYDAFARQAASYEDAQHLLFREEEFDQRLENGDGLSEEEQRIFQDMVLIKSFLTASATQLTPWGLEVITNAVGPGKFAILFRNDHFSTLYRHPHTLQLMQLVTDAGYAAHSDVVWESLTDVQGERAEFFSGDFRARSAEGHGASGAQNPRHDTSSHPQTNSSSSSGHAPSSSSFSGGGGNADPSLSTREQEDGDFALAMQLQEEEEARVQREDDERRRLSQRSQNVELQHQQQHQYDNRQGRLPQPVPRQRASSAAGRTATLGGPMVIRQPPQGFTAPASIPPPPPLTYRPSDEDDNAPPSYDVASKQAAYQPPTGHPSHPESSAVPQSPQISQIRPGSTHGARLSDPRNGSHVPGTFSPGPRPRTASARPLGRPTLPVSLEGSGSSRHSDQNKCRVM